MANEALNLALQRMQEALKLIDISEGALEVGAHLDLAICRLREVLASEDMLPRNDNHVPVYQCPDDKASDSAT